MVLKWRQTAIAVLFLLELSALATVFLGCGLFEFTGRSDTFDHRLHRAQEITCDACHQTFDTMPAAGMPSYHTCQVCHGPSEDREPYPYELEIQEHDPEQPFLVSRVPHDLKFSHVAHLEKELECADCHDLTRATPAVAEPLVPERCEECHREADLDFDCSLCHETLAVDRRPPSHHGTSWTRLHGREAEYAADGGHRESCGLCHSDSYCDTCHRFEKPQDHTEFFRQRSHGFIVELDRERCTVCHQEDFCVRCHQDTTPRSHSRPSWGGLTTSNHCLYCHEPLSDNGCWVCHRSTASHRQATPIPGPPHQPAFVDCRRCHLRPPHADNGDDCTNCHK